MKYKKRMVSAVFILLSLGGVSAQQNSIATGGEANGSGGTANYSVGQVAYSTNIGTNGSIAQGVQQAYTISFVTDVNIKPIPIEMNVYPNPTSNFIQLEVENDKYAGLSYRLYSASGQMMENKDVLGKISTIKMDQLPRATYILKITNDDKEVTTFKIVKQ